MKDKPKDTKIEKWERRLRWLAGHDKTPKDIAHDLVCCLHELDVLRAANVTVIDHSENK